MYVCWRGAMESRKDRSSVFDLFIVSIFLGLIAGRTIYILSNLQGFSQLIWYWLPYERYANEVYWFRLLPWKLFDIFDGGLNILIMFVGYLFTASFWSTFVKKWRWSDMFPTIYFSGEVMLSMSFILIGLSSGNSRWIYEGLVLLVFPVISVALIGYVNKIQKPQQEKRIYVAANILLVVLSCAAIGYIYFTGEIQFERIATIALSVWTLGGLIFFIKDAKRANVVIEKVSSVRGVDINQPIKLPR
ncbi:MAG: hypothetical protein US24_C0005G0021 [candidate division WS6 bacterium GW2011_GWC2_36_7]|uniref:Uncharacterized protein n=2 Tax=Candidatus Dojkabacteria TaxID=74243 RepID=A0A0G0HJ95_9BACT|nr:MAG: hypothetical protein US24_C0005G0021 [candidate division WS6 bacterium GW2011_GWC2_36_7]